MVISQVPLQQHLHLYFEGVGVFDLGIWPFALEHMEGPIPRIIGLVLADEESFLQAIDRRHERPIVEPRLLTELFWRQRPRHLEGTQHSLLTIVESWRRPRVGIGHGWYRLKTTEQFDVTLFAVHRADQPVAGQTPGQLR